MFVASLNDKTVKLGRRAVGWPEWPLDLSIIFLGIIVDLKQTVASFE